jgi:hypothetical protein
MPRFTAKVALSYLGDRIEKGQEFEIAKADVAAFDPEDIAPVDGADAPEEEAPEEAIPLEEMTQAQLKARAKELGLKQSGSVADLVERITLHLASGGSDEQPAEETTSEEGGSDEQPGE